MTQLLRHSDLFPSDGPQEPVAQQGGLLLHADLFPEEPRGPLDPRDFAAQRPIDERRPAPRYLGAIGEANVNPPQPRIPGIAGRSGSALSDGMAEVTSFFETLEAERQARGIRTAGEMEMQRRVGQYGAAQPISGPELTFGSAASYLAGVPGRALRQIRGGIRTAFGAAVGSEEMMRRGEKEIARAETEAQAARPDTSSNVLADWTLSALESIALMATGAAAGVPGVLGVFGASTGAQTYGRLREEGVGRGRAAAAGAVSGTLEAATELVPVKLLLSRFGKNGIAKFMAQLVAADVGGETANAFGQAMAEEIARHPELPISEAAKVASQEVARQFPDIVGTVAIQSAILGGASAAARKASRRSPDVEVTPSQEAEAAIAEMQRQQAQRERVQEEAARTVGVRPDQPWANVKGAFVEEKTADGGTVYRTPSGARITPEDWAAASGRLRTMWLQPAEQKQEEQPKPAAPTPEQILRMRPTEQVVLTKGAPLRSEKLDRLLDERAKAVSPEVKKRLDREIAQEREAIERRLAAEEFAQMAEEEADPQRKALLWNAAANLIAPRGRAEKEEAPPRRGITVTELDDVVAQRSKDEEERRPTISGITVTEVEPREFERATGVGVDEQQQPDERQKQLEAEIETEAQRQREAEIIPLHERQRDVRKRSLAATISATRARTEELQSELERIKGSPAAEPVRRLVAQQKRDLRDLASAHEMFVEAQNTKDEEVATTLRERAQAIVDRIAKKARKKNKTPLVPKTEKEVTKISQSPLLQGIMKHSRGLGISADIMGDIGVEEPTFYKEYNTTTKSGKFVVRKVPRKLRYMMGFNVPLFQKNKRSLQEDGIMEALVERGYLPREAMSAISDIRWQDIALDMVRRELENPGSVVPIADVGMREMYAYERQMREEGVLHAREDARMLGLDVEGMSDEEVERAVSAAFVADWTGLPEQQRSELDAWREQHGLDDSQASMAAIVRLASEIDEQAVHDAAVRYADDDVGFMRAVWEILNDPANQPAVQSRIGDARAFVQKLAGKGEGTPDLAARIAQGSAADQAAAGREQAAGAGVAAEDAEAVGPRPDDGQQRAATQRRTDVADDKIAADLLSRFQDSIRARFRNDGITFRLADPSDIATLGRSRALENTLAGAVFDNLARDLGLDLKLVWYEQQGGPNIEGASPSYAPNVVMLNVRTEKPALGVIAHEFLHWLKKNHREDYDFFVRNVAPALRRIPEHQAWLAERYRQAGADALSAEQALEELYADVWARAFTDRRFYEHLARSNPTAFQRFANFVRDLISGVIRMLRSMRDADAEPYIADLQRAYKAIGDTLTRIKERFDRENELKRSVEDAMRDLGLEPKLNEDLSLAQAAVDPPTELVQLPEENLVEARLFDSMNRLAQLEEAYYQQTGQRLPDEESVRLVEKLFHGRVQHKANKFEQEYLKPLGKALKGLKRVGLTIRDADDYLMALHAPERNATLQMRDPDGREGLSGITDEMARDILRSFNDEQKRALEEVRKHVRRIVDYRLDLLTESGLVKPATVAYLRSRWPNYVPLKTLDVENRQLGTGVGFEMWANDIKTAFGRTTRASTPIGFVLTDAARTIVRSEKARVEQSIWKLAQRPELAGILRVYDADDPPPQVMRKELTEDGEVRSVVDMGKYDRHVMSVVIDGEQRRVFIADEVLRRQLARAGEFENLDPIIEGIGALTRTLGRTLTEWNPSWFLPNAVKDAIAATIRATGIKGMSAARVVAQIPKAWVDIVAHKFGLDTKGARLYEEFASAGGITGAYGIMQPEDFLRDMARRGANVGYLYGDRSLADKALDPARAFLNVISAANEVVEYATRFAAYKEARRANYSKERAAEIAKEITVNFNRRGEIGKPFGALYVFFNASLQGLYGTLSFFGATRSQIAKGALNPVPVIAGAVALTVLGALMQGVNELVGGEDEEIGDLVVNAHSDFILDHNLSLVGLGPDGARIAKVPLPPEYASFYGIGRRLYRAASQGDVTREAAGIAGLILDATLPVRFAEIPSRFTPEGGAVEAVFKAVSPSLLGPVAEIIANTNFLGARIVPDPIGSGPMPPYYTLSRPTTSELAKWVSKFLNDATGGDAIRPGLSQKVLGRFASPEAMEHLVRTYGGGLGQFGAQSVNIARIAAGQQKEVELGKIPVVSRFYSERPASYIDRRYRDIADEVQYAKRALKAGEEPHDAAAAAIAGQYDAAERMLRPLYRDFRNAAEVGDEERKKQIREQIAAIKSTVLKAYNETKREGAKQQ